MKKEIDIPENPTNGDIIKALFPNCEWFIIESLKSVNVCTDPSLTTQTFDTYWWNAPYSGSDNMPVKREVEDER